MFDNRVDISKVYGSKKFVKRRKPTTEKPKTKLIRWDSEEKRRRHQFAVEANYQESLGRYYKRHF